ncbi:MAG: M15 family metallopeptidase [Nannocystaceae bacterium]
MGSQGTGRARRGGPARVAVAGLLAALACVTETERPTPPRTASAAPRPRPPVAVEAVMVTQTDVASRRALPRERTDAALADEAATQGALAPDSGATDGSAASPGDDRSDAQIDPQTDAEAGADAAPAADPDDEATCERRCVGGDQDGDDLRTPVDRDHGLLPSWAPADLVALDPPYVIPEGSPPNLLRAPAAAAFVRLSDAAFAATGVRVNIRSGYRPFDLQCAIFRGELRRLGCVEATRSSARAGFSEHQLGTTADLAIGWRRLDGEAAIDDYLRAHAHEHGWVLSYPDGAEATTGYKHEPWHYRYVGVDAAADLVARSGPARRLSTQEYLGAPAAGER